MSGMADRDAEQMAEAGGLDALDALDAGRDLEIVSETAALASLEQGAISSQVATALAHPRSIRRFLDELKTYCTVSPAVALACQFSIPRDGKRILGPSVRFAELVLSSFGNLRVEGILAEPGERSVTAYGTCIDLEKNVGVRVVATRRITRKDGSRYGDDMIQTTQQAAVSIAIRNAILRVVPRTLWAGPLEAARQVAAGGAGAFGDRRQKAFDHLREKWKIEPARILAHLERERVDDVTLDDVVLLRVIAEELARGDVKAAEAFPAPTLRSSDESRSKAAAAADAALAQPTGPPNIEVRNSGETRDAKEKTK